MKIIETLGATSRIWQIFIADNSSTTGAGLTGLLFNTASLTAYYHRDTDTTATAITLVTMTVGTFTSSGFKEIDATNMPGWYQLCPPNAALASGAKSVALLLKGATNMAPLPIEVQLSAVDLTDAVRGGMTAMPNANAGASGGLHINGSNSGTTTYAALTVTGSFTVSDGLLVSRSTSNASAATFTGNGTGSGAVFTSGAGATGDGVQMTAGSTNGNGLKLTKTGSGSDFNATVTPLVLAKTTNLTGLNDIAATSIVSSGAITTSGGAVSTVTTTNAIGSGGITDASFAADASPKAIATGTAQAGAATTITLAAGANANNNFYNNTLIKLTGGTGVGQSRFISAYVGATKVATVATWVTNPDNTTTYDIVPFDAVAGASAPTAAQVATAVWQDTTAGDFTVASSIGKSLYTTGNAPGTASGIALVGSNMGTVSSVTGNVGGNLVGNVNGTVPDSSGVTTLLSRLSAARAGVIDALSVRTGTAQAGAASTITLDASASATDNLYKDQWVVITSGTGAGQARLITGYVGSTKVATVERAWATNPDNTSVFYLLTAAGIAHVVLADTATTVTNGVVLAAAAIDSASLATSGKNAIADSLLDRDMSTGTDSGTEIIRTPRQALRVLRNKVDIPNGKVKKEDDATDSWTFAVTTAAGNPVVTVDPT